MGVYIIKFQLVKIITIYLWLRVYVLWYFFVANTLLKKVKPITKLFYFPFFILETINFDSMA